MDKTQSTSPKKIFPTSNGANVKMASTRKITSPKKAFPISIEAASNMGSSKTLFSTSTGTISLAPAPSKSTSPKKFLPTSSGATYKVAGLRKITSPASSKKILPISTVVASQVASPRKILPISTGVASLVASPSKSSFPETSLPPISATGPQKFSPKRNLPTSSGALSKVTCPYKSNCSRRILPSSSGGAPQEVSSEHICDFHCGGIHEEGSDIVVVKSPNRPPLYVPADSVQAVHATSSPKQHKCDISCGSPRRSPRHVVMPAATKVGCQCSKVQEMANSPRTSPRNILASSIEAISLQGSPKRGECDFHCMCFHEGVDHNSPGTSHLLLLLSPKKRHKKLLQANQEFLRAEREEEAEKLRLQLEEEKMELEKLKQSQPPKSPRSILGARRRLPHTHAKNDKFKF